MKNYSVIITKTIYYAVEVRAPTEATAEQKAERLFLKLPERQQDECQIDGVETSACYAEEVEK